MILIGYARVSTINQNEDRQIQELIKYGVEEKRIYIDKQSGKDFHRPSYMKMLKRLKKGDVLVVKSIDRLGRNYREIQEEWRIITHKRNADIVVLDMPLLDTTRSKGFARYIYSRLGVAAAVFRSGKRKNEYTSKTSRRHCRRKKRGVKFGRPPIPKPDNFDEMYKLWKDKKITARNAAKNCDLTIDTFYRMVKSKMYCKKYTFCLVDAICIMFLQI